MNRLLIVVLLVIGFCSISLTWPPKLEKKVYATIKKTFAIEEVSVVPLAIDEGIDSNAKKVLEDNFFDVSNGVNHLGYAYVGAAPSMKNVFDYIVLFDNDLQILNTKVLIYREKHGRQIGMKRWLKQFFGMGPDDRPELGVQVDGISGATISATSMTDAVREVLESIDVLNKNSKI